MCTLENHVLGLSLCVAEKLNYNCISDDTPPQKKKIEYSYPLIHRRKWVIENNIMGRTV